jgi:hypothetical protein
MVLFERGVWAGPLFVSEANDFTVGRLAAGSMTA